jgi:hypothetical protein
MLVRHRHETWHGGENKSDRDGSYTCDADVARRRRLPSVPNCAELDRTSANIQAHRFGMPKGLLETAQHGTLVALHLQEAGQFR